MWNSLPNVVVLAKTVNYFKSNLDEVWPHQDVKYDFQAEIIKIVTQVICDKLS